MDQGVSASHACGHAGSSGMKWPHDTPGAPAPGEKGPYPDGSEYMQPHLAPAGAIDVTSRAAPRPASGPITQRETQRPADGFLPTLGELIAMRVASAVAYRLSIKGGGRSFLVETGYRGAIGSAGRLVRLSREAPPRAVELPAGLVLPLTYAILGMLSQGPCCQVGGPPPPAVPEFRFAFESAAPFRSAGQGAGCRCGAGARDATSQET